jgi:hypothetical protein
MNQKASIKTMHIMTLQVDDESKSLHQNYTYHDPPGGGIPVLERGHISRIVIMHFS